MMETNILRGKAHDNGVASQKNQSVLILNQNSAPCAADKCDGLLGLLQRSLPVSCVQKENGNLLSGELPFIPDLILLRVSVGRAAQKLIASCKRIWSCAAILALFCVGSNDPIDILPSDFDAADDFVSCPFREGELTLRIKRLLQSKSGSKMSSARPWEKINFYAVSMVGESPCFLRVTEQIPLLADSQATVLISGETGSGKEVMARAIHYQSARSGKPFIPVNCGALPDHLFENELFGHAKGAYTDASSPQKGLIAEAEEGTLFLDEVDALSQSGQVKLLRFLENGEYRPLGASRGITANVRIIAATNADLLERVKAKLFREDLYYRLSALSVIIPPLRERMEDIIHLSNHFLTQYAKERNTQRRDISSEALSKLMAHEWPGNVRELEGLILRALVLTTSATLQPEDMNLPQQSPTPTQEDSLLRRAKTNMIQNFEVGYLTNLLAAHHGNITHAAIAAGKQRSTLQRLLRKYSLNPQSFRV
jgi:DNA-binding NtrC family response regulator